MARFLHWLIRCYQIAISPLLGPRCRYIPTCSQYALEAVALYGAGHGSWLALKRVCRCHPWGGQGYDPLPSLQQPVRQFVSFQPLDAKQVKPGVPFRHY